MQNRVFAVREKGDDHFLLEIGYTKPEFLIRTRGIILATGRFLGGGLKATRNGIFESIFDIPALQPTRRAEWHRHDFWDPRGHPINQVGLEVDSCFRPLSKCGDPAFETLFAVGSILAHNDWTRLKCGTGVSVSSAYRAIKSFLGVTHRQEQPSFGGSVLEGARTP